MEMNFQQASEMMFDVNELYGYIESFAVEKGYDQTLAVLPYAKEKHAGQLRKGPVPVPFIYHPLMLARHAIALGIADDTLLSAALLHDVCEDCDVEPEALPVNDETRTVVINLTKIEEKDSPEGLAKYYNKLSKNRYSVIIKLLDRCSNVVGMRFAFSEEKLAKYKKETREYVYPLFDIIRKDFPEYEQQAFLLEYHIKSLTESK